MYSSMADEQGVTELQTIEEILKIWGLEQLIPTFQEHCVNFDTLQLLSSSPELLKELVPKIGLRMALSKKLTAWKSAEHHVQEIMEDTPSPSHTDFECPSTSSSQISDEDVLSVVSTVNIFPEATVGLSEAQIMETPAFQHKVQCAKKTGLEDLLNTTIRGKIIQSAYAVNKKLTSEYRNKLVELIVESELKDDINRKISCSHFDELAHAISALFPTEFKEVYFMKTHYKRGVRTRTIGKGKLFAKYYNYRKQLKAAGLIRGGNSELASHEDIDIDIHESDDDEVNEKILWLKNNKEPYQTVEQNWRDTFVARKNILKNTAIHDYFKLFPVLTTDTGYLLFDIDYKIHYPDNDNFYVNWPNFSTNIITYAESLNDKHLKALVHDIKSTKLEEAKCTKILKLLSSLATPVAVTRKWKPSRSEISEGFLMHVKVIQDLPEAIKKKNNKLSSYKLSFQPTPIIVGTDLDNIIACYVRVNETLYKVETPLKSIEVTFKAIHSLNALYPADAEQIWIIIQKGLFKLSTKFDKQFTFVNTILPLLLEER